MDFLVQKNGLFFKTNTGQNKRDNKNNKKKNNREIQNNALV